MFRIKICGVMTPKDAQLIALAGADAVGLNFFSDSPRYLTPEAADLVAAAVSPKLERVGVFVNASVEEMRSTAERLKLNWIQLHGDETPAIIAELKGFQVLKAFRIGETGYQSAFEFLKECQSRNAPPAAVLLDASVPGEFGGTGKALDWSGVLAAKEQLGLPVVLAGGLTPFNVVDAIAAAKPDAVDVASGVESKPGTKDLMLIRAFVMGAKKGFAALAS